jgi:hypothetical protein
LKANGGVVRLDAMTYQIHRYPTELIDVIHLTDGERVVIRPVLPQDRELMVAFFHDLPADARCSRFMHAVSEPSPELLREFTQVDYVNHVALVAEVFVDGRETAIGEARYVRTADPSSAEVAVSVAEHLAGQRTRRADAHQTRMPRGCGWRSPALQRDLGHQREGSIARTEGWVRDYGDD